MTQELVERLRARRKRELTLSLTGVAWEPLVNPDGPEAADALQSQSARIAELSGLLREARQHVRTMDGFIAAKIDATLSLTKDSTSVTG